MTCERKTCSSYILRVGPPSKQACTNLLAKEATAKRLSESASPGYGASVAETGAGSLRPSRNHWSDGFTINIIKGSEA